ncbi:MULTISPECIES: adenosine deaminase [unclassified Mesorhizobium]|uniref:adenosine deaminase n=1 Tax=unclassified Mesorhizobium TaxID=325217 RepID=UPI000BAEB0B6|nr:MULTISPECIES: adenosine deaminase [unclassified Mesorhizobium]TGT56530.1 adenosine deaminase [Mesorhizobium sp. M00.F.Ca.ET.170.01.1.1]AZO11588.1 adenosine deaminase [Mesorhizobium sp. M3A.F.Ca.ET.080.04.2.1]PBB86936.1 adenosine deaminase [Mesorhizobium sp. WSM3876]RWB72776.1 MAG: adenosine deaminase [Mesorhizobium sp.]RWB86950.1 MAG: adenosine deaminase [Mesorhizobium sp.]
MVLKAELHCHIEGAAAPELVVAQARKYGKDPSAYIQNGSFVWHDFTSFLEAYDFASDLFRSEEDYARLTDHYLTSLARDGAIYSEVFTSPDHAVKAGLSPKAYTDALGEGMVRAKARTGIEGRMIVTGVRHVGVEAIEQAARFAARCGHPLVTGFGVAGDERIGDFEDYVRAFEIAREAGLGITIHAGELMGWESVAAALDHIRPSRIGHGVRAIENPDLVRRIADQGVVLECCPGSNIALKVFGSFAEHPFPALRAAGCKVTLNSDDPPYFWTSLKREYDLAAEHFAMDDKALAAVTRTAIEAAFVDRKTKAALLSRLDAKGR